MSSNLTPEIAQQLLKKNIQNVMAKLANGSTLTEAERRTIEAEAAKAPKAPEPKVPAGRPLKFTKKQISAAIRGCRGHKRTVMAKLGMGDDNYRVLNQYLTRFPDLQEQMDRESRTGVDFASAKLFEVMSNDKHPKQVTSLIFFLKCHGKEDGWVERQQIEHSGIEGGGVMVVPAHASEGDWEAEAKKQQEELKRAGKK